MYEGNPVDLQMEKVISADAIFDDTTRVCKVDHYDTEEDYIYLEVMEDPLTTILLDAKYRCYIPSFRIRQYSLYLIFHIQINRKTKVISLYKP